MAFIANRLSKIFRLERHRIIFVHGFNNTPDQIRSREKAIRDILPGHVEFSTQNWTSVAGIANGLGIPEAFSALLYPLDNKLTKGFFSTELIRPKHSFFRKEKVSIVAHSRGNALVVHSLLNKPSQLDHIHRFAMLHPDVDAATFGRLPELFRHEKVKVFDTKGDFATTVSGIVDGSRDLSTYVKHQHRHLSASHNHWVDKPTALEEVIDWVSDF